MWRKPPSFSPFVSYSPCPANSMVEIGVTGEIHNFSLQAIFYLLIKSRLRRRNKTIGQTAGPRKSMYRFTQVFFLIPLFLLLTNELSQWIELFQKCCIWSKWYKPTAFLLQQTKHINGICYQKNKYLATLKFYLNCKMLDTFPLFFRYIMDFLIDKFCIGGSIPHLKTDIKWKGNS